MVRFSTALLLAAAAAGGQDPISLIRARVAETTARTPNYTCLETIERRWYADEYATSQVLDRMRFEVAVIDGKEQFAWPGGSRFDSQELQKLLERGLTKTGDFSGFLSGIFGSNSATYTLVGEQPAAIRRAIRYDYRVAQANSGYRMALNGVQALVGFHGSFWVDPETLDLTRLEIEGDDIPPVLKTSSAKMAIDYGLVAVGAGSFLLPQATDVRLVSDRGLASRTITRFSQCRQFLAESSISFEERPVEQVANQTDAGAELPPGVTLEVGLAAPISRKTAATGDVVEAELRKDVKAKGGILVPKGAAVEGRILLLETRGSAHPSDLLVLRFTKLRFGARRFRLRASVVRFAIRNRGLLGSLRWGEDEAPRISPGTPMVFWGGFLELPKGSALTLETEAVPSP
jgi:hypothetical protein